MFYKPEFRKKISALRADLKKEAIMQAAIQSAAQLIVLPAFLEAKNIGCYMAAGGEFDPVVIAHSAHILGKSLYLPKMQKDKQESMMFYPYVWGESLKKNEYGIEEPDADITAPVSPEKIDCYLVPLIGFDVHGNRLGRGAGYYDRYLAFTKKMPAKSRPVIIGLGYEFQKISEITPDEWDVPMDFVVTETTIYERI